MSWSPEQWDGFAALVNAAFAGEFTDADRKAWRVLLNDVEPDAAMRALKSLTLRGQVFRSVGELMAEVRRDPSLPTWDETYLLLYRGAATGELPPGAHPMVSAFFIRQGGAARLGQLPLDDPEWGSKHRRDLQQAWEAHCEAFEGREIALLAAGSGRDGLARLDPLAALGRGPVGTLEPGS